MKDQILDKIIRFDILLGISAIGTALVAAFFSVYGIATLFGGAAISVAIMASVLEIAKLVLVTYLYRYWKQTKSWLTTYLSTALIILMVITSGGIFGYLSAAYQKSSTVYKAEQNQIVLVEKTKVYAQNKIDQSQIRINNLNDLRKAQEARMSEALTNVFISRNAIALKQLQDQTAEMIKNTENEVKSEQNKIDTGIKELSDIDKKVSEMKFGKNNKDIKTFEFVAKLFNTDLDTVVKWFIFLLIAVFDPLAVALILAYNVVVYKKPIIPTIDSENINTDQEEDKKKVITQTPMTFPLQKIPKKVEELPIPKPPNIPELSSADLDFIKSYFKS